MTLSMHRYGMFFQGEYFDIKSGSLTLDEAFAPYVRGSLTIAMPTLEVLAKLDPRPGSAMYDPYAIIVANCTHKNAYVTAPNRVDLNPTTIPDSNINARVWLRRRTIDHEAGEVTLEFASAEAQWQDYALLADKPVRLESSSVLTALSTVMSIIPTATDGYIATDFKSPNLPTLIRTNLCTNTRFATNATSWSSTRASITRTSIAGLGSVALLFPTDPADSDGFMQSAFVPSAGKTYTVSLDYTLSAPIAGTQHSRARKLIVFVRNAPGGTYTEFSSEQAPNVGGVTSRLTVTFTVPAGVTDSLIRVYHGGLSVVGQQNAYVTKVLIEETPFQRSLFDGARSNLPGTTYTWNGTANASTSRATEIASVGDIATDWAPGQTAWDFLEPLLAAARVRVFCNENAEMRVAPVGYTTPGTVRISEGVNLTRATDDISRRADSDWCDSVLVKYSWIDAAGVSQTAYDIAKGDRPRKVKVVEIAAPYPGPGAAAYILNRSTGRGRVLNLEAISNYSTRPGQEIVATLPGSPMSVGFLAAVTFNFGTDEMQVTSRELTDTAANSWLLAPAGRKWTDNPAGVTWNTYTN